MTASTISKTVDLLHKASKRVFELDEYGYELAEIVDILDSEISLSMYNGTLKGDAPKFSQAMVKTMLDYENIAYMMATAHKAGPEVDDRLSKYFNKG